MASSYWQAPSDILWPELDEATVAHLEGLFPPRCMQPDEHVEDHLRYAGAVDLVALLRHHLTLQQQADAAQPEGE